ncbi:hypothetical protein LP419_33805 [Massilia sp. H-1]|nr:hypothetical protein LP419_33805 [Massilia sp. H-1]
MREYTELIADKIRAAAKARIKPRTVGPGAAPPVLLRPCAARSRRRKN